MSHPGEWNLPGGGIDPGESAQQAAVREAGEEAGFDRQRHRARVGWTHQGPVYTTIAARLERPFTPVLNWESDRSAWVTRKQALALKLHPLLRELFEGVTDGFALRSRGRAARRLKGKVRERAPSADPWRHVGVFAPASGGMKRAQAAVGRYQDSHQLLHHLSTSETMQRRGWSPPEIEALFLAASWVRAWEAGKLGTRALARRLDRLDQDLAQVIEGREPGTDYEQLDYDHDESVEEGGDEELLWKEDEARVLPRWKDATDRWRDGEAPHYEARGLVIDLEARKRRRGGYTVNDDWVEIDGRPVRYARLLQGAYPNHTWIDDKTGTVFSGREHPSGPPAFYDDVDGAVLIKRYHELVPAPRYARDTPVRWVEALGHRRSATFGQTADPLRRRKKWGRAARRRKLAPPVLARRGRGARAQQLRRFRGWPAHRIGTESPHKGARLAPVDPFARDLGDTQTPTAESVLLDYAPPGTYDVYRSYVDFLDLPAPRLVERESASAEQSACLEEADMNHRRCLARGTVAAICDDDLDLDEADCAAWADPQEGYDWTELEHSRSASLVPAPKLLVDSEGHITILDGNHRLTFWEEQGVEAVLVWVVHAVPQSGKSPARRRGRGRQARVRWRQR